MPPPEFNRVSVRFPSGLDGGKLRRCKAIVGISLPTPGRASIGSSFITEQSLQAILKKSNSSFAECRLVLGDLLQRHNVRLLNPESDGEKEAEELGTEWIERNRSFLVGSATHLIRWREIFEDSVLIDKAREIFGVYESSSDEGMRLRAIIEETAGRFAERYCRGNGEEFPPITDLVEQARIKESSKSYIKEELAYLIAYAIKHRISYFLYPGDEEDFPAFTEARKIFLKDGDQDLLQWMKVTFKILKPRAKLSGRKVEDIADSASSHDSGSDCGSPRRRDDADVAKDGVEKTEMVLLREEMERMRAEFRERFQIVQQLLIAVVSSGRPLNIELQKATSSPELHNRVGVSTASAGFFKVSDPPTIGSQVKGSGMIPRSIP